MSGNTSLMWKFLLLTLLICCPVWAAPVVESPGIDQALQQPRVLVLDVREDAEIAETGTIEGSLHIPIGELEKRLAEVPRDRPILVA